MICHMTSASTRPMATIHFTTRNHARKYVVAARGEPEIISPNNHTQPSISARVPKKIRI